MKESKDPQGDRFVGLTESATKGFMKDVFKLEVVFDFEPDLIVENPVFWVRSPCLSYHMVTSQPALGSATTSLA